MKILPLLLLLSFNSIAQWSTNDTVFVARIWGGNGRLKVRLDSLKYFTRLNNVNNTSDANKPVSTATQIALNLKANISDTANMLANYSRNSSVALKAPIASPTFTGTVSGITASMVGLGNVTNESKATMFTNATFTGTFTAPNTTITNAMLAGSIDLTTKVTGVLPFSSNAGSSAATSATTGTMTVPMTSRIITITPTNACTFNGTNGVVGQTVTFVVTTSGTSSFVLTWGTNYRTTGTLTTGTTTAKIFCVTFICVNATPTWVEIARTAAQ